MTSESPATLIGPRLAQLQRDLAAGPAAAPADFWREVERRGTLLVECAEDDNHVCLVTSVCRAPAEGARIGGQEKEG